MHRSRGVTEWLRSVVSINANSGHLWEPSCRLLKLRSSSCGGGVGLRTMDIILYGGFADLPHFNPDSTMELSRFR
jgi:hypothetical protein